MHCIVNIKQFMEFLYFTFHACLRHRFLDADTNPGPRRPLPDVCKCLCSNMRCLAWNLSDMIVPSFQYDILLCSETLDSDTLKKKVYTCWSTWFPDSIALTCCVGERCLGFERWLRDGYWAFLKRKFQCGCCEMLVFTVYGMRHSLHVFRF